MCFLNRYLLTVVHRGPMKCGALSRTRGTATLCVTGALNACRNSRNSAIICPKRLNLFEPGSCRLRFNWLLTNVSTGKTRDKNLLAAQRWLGCPAEAPAAGLCQSLATVRCPRCSKLAFLSLRSQRGVRWNGSEWDSMEREGIWTIPTF